MKAKLSILSAVLFFVFVTGIYPQDKNFFIPNEIRRAYKKGTRDYKGVPGINYRQNRSDYVIKAELNPGTAMVSGSGEITYYNNSSDTLKSVVLRLYADVFKKGNVHNIEIEPEDLHDGVKIISAKVGNDVFDVSQNSKTAFRQGTKLILKLKNYILPSSKEKIYIDWELSLPKKTFIRIGAYNQNNLFVGLWYPQVAVYDDIRKWDMQDYLAQQEYYNDFGNFDVEITVPEGYVVWGTGELQNAKEVLREDIFEKYEKAKSSDGIIKVINENDYAKGVVTAKGSKLIWKFKAEMVSDFAFGVSNNYLWDAVITPAGGNGKNVFVSAAYSKESQDFAEVCDIALKSINYYSNVFPGIPFPFPVMTVYNGADGMEFPMITNDGSFDSRAGTVYVTSHEILHMYFPFLVGTDETRYAFMDEGFAVYIPEELQMQIEPELDQKLKQTEFFSRASGVASEPPLINYSTYLYGNQYFASYYGKSERALVTLEELIGREKMKEAFIEFTNRWKYKHPTPYDFFFTFNDVTGMDLSWFWKAWYFDYNFADYEITSTENSKVIIKNVGKLPLPVELKVFYTDGSEEVFKQKPSPDEVIYISANPQKEILKAELGGKYISDVDKSNNVFPR
ncbi:MAG: M1 family metallopeptidase [Ignavibacteria bacterium]|nr:M1 family metallopeptidase [Ignavibacteria bacterium]